MIKKDIFKGELKEQLKASSEDRLHSFVMAEGTIRGAVVKTTRMISEMRANHDLGPVETILLGHAYIASALLVANLKAKERIGISIDCSGPLKGIDVESNVFGEVRGYLKNSNIRIKEMREPSSLSQLFGAGFLTVTKYLQGAGRPYSGRVALMYGSVAKDLANYFLKSEQIPTGFNLSVDLNHDYEVTGAGGVFLQAMPEAEENTRQSAEKMLDGASSLGASFSRGEAPERFVAREFANLDPVFLNSRRVEFFCRCSRKKTKDYISKLPREDIAGILQECDFPLTTRCHNCNSVYSFSRRDIEVLQSGRRNREQ